MMKESNNDASTNLAGKETGIIKMKSPFSILVLAMISGIVAYSHHDGLSKSNPPKDVSALLETDARRRLDINDDERVMAFVRQTWAECAELRWSGVECKNFIDEEILSPQTTGDDRLTRTIIVGKRNKMEEWYNTMVIYMGDDDIVLGRDGDGLVHYDFDWEGAGVEATPEQQAEIPPVIATETPEGSPLADPNNPASDPNSPEYNPLILEFQPILVMGASNAGARSGSDQRPINGGVVINLNVQNINVLIDQAVAAALAAADAAAVEAAGARKLEPFDCTGMTGFNCCLMIKSIVKDADIYGKSIQCHLNYVETSYKAKHFLNHRGKKVHIFTNHNFVVTKTPKVVGSWPAVGDLEGWVEAGGTDGYAGVGE